MRLKLQAILRTLVVALFLSYYGGANLFSHTHHYQWGDVTHSHPYLPSANHSHTAASCYVIDSLSLMQFVEGSETFVFTNVVASVVFSLECEERVLHFDTTQCGLRAPPSSYLLMAV